MTKRKHRAARTVLLLFLILLALLLAAAAVCTGLALTDKNADKYTLTETDTSCSDEVLKGALLGRNIRLSEVQFNTYLNMLFCRQQDSRPTYLKNLRLYFHRSGDTEIYARLHFWDHDFSLYARAEIMQQPLSGEAAVRLYDVRLGELPLPDPVVDLVLKRITGDREHIRYEDGVLYVQTLFEYELGGIHLTLHLKKLQPADGYINCRTNNLTVEVITSVYEYLNTEEGRDLCQRVFGSDIDDWKNKLAELFK